MIFPSTSSKENISFHYGMHSYELPLPADEIATGHSTFAMTEDLPHLFLHSLRLASTDNTPAAYHTLFICFSVPSTYSGDIGALDEIGKLVPSSSPTMRVLANGWMYNITDDFIGNVTDVLISSTGNITVYCSQNSLGNSKTKEHHRRHHSRFRIVPSQ